MGVARRVDKQAYKSRRVELMQERSEKQFHVIFCACLHDSMYINRVQHGEWLEWLQTSRSDISG